MKQCKRCPWATQDPLYITYHDQEWGVPVYDDQKLFEMLVLEGMQAGLSWITILKRRDNYRRLFDDFDPERIVNYSDQKLQKILQNEGIIRNRAKVYSIRNNAQAFLNVRDQFEQFSTYIWQFVAGRPVQNKFRRRADVPVTTKESDLMAKDLKKRGFTFVGSTICYAYMQAVGMVNDHLTSCFRHSTLIHKS